MISTNQLDVAQIHVRLLIDFQPSADTLPTMPIFGTGASSSFLTVPLLSINGRKARYGVSYLRNICAQAGLALSESSIDEDVQSIDANIHFQIGSVYVQVKCIGSSQLDSNADVSLSLRDNWIENWKPIKLPVYIVAVLVPDDDFINWIKHEPANTNHKANAFWIRFDPQMTGKTVRIPRINRLSVSTFDSWSRDLAAVFIPGSEA